MRVIDAVKTIDPVTFQPKMVVQLEFDVERIPEQTVGNESVYASIGLELTQKIELFRKKRTPGIAIYEMDAPTMYAEYQTISGNQNFRVPLDAQTLKLRSLNDLGLQMQAEFGENADVFVYKLMSNEVVNPVLLKSEFIYMIRMAAVTEKFRNENNIDHYIRKGF